MVVICSIVGCSATYDGFGIEPVSLFGLPTIITNQCDRTKELSTQRRALWLSRINRKFNKKRRLTRDIKVCNKHFLLGKPAKLFDHTHPDWVPSLNIDGNSSTTCQEDEDNRAASPGLKRKENFEAANSLDGNKIQLVDINKLTEKSGRHQKFHRDADNLNSAPTTSSTSTSTADNFVDMTKLQPLMDIPSSSPADPLHTFMDLDVDVKPPIPTLEIDDDEEEEEDVKPILPIASTSSAATTDSLNSSADIMALNFHNYAKDIRTLPSLVPNPNNAVLPKQMLTSIAPRPVQNYFLIQTLGVPTPAKVVVNRPTEKQSETVSKRDSYTQTTFVYKEMLTLKDENARLKQEASAMKNELMLNEMRRVKNPQSVTAFVDSLRDDNKKCKFYTGFQFEQIETVLDVLSPLNDMIYWGTTKPANQTRLRKLKPIEELTLTLVRLRTGLMMQDLSYRFNVSMGSITRIVNTWVNHASVKFKFMRFDMAAASREMPGKTLPAAFNWSKDMNVVMECAEFLSEKVVRPPPQQQSTPFCPKAHTTFKVLLGCTHPNGAVSFVSEVFHGSLSDEEIVEESNLRHLSDRGDFILTNGSFDIAKHLSGSKNKSFNTRPVRQIASSDEEEEEEEQEDHEEEQEREVEREAETPGQIETKIEEKLHYKHVVGRLKEFKLLQKVLPFSMSGTLSQLIFVCACLLNFQTPVLKKIANAKGF